MDTAQDLSVERAAFIKRQAIALMAHQGMAPSPEDVADADLFLAGKISEKEFTARVDARVAAMPNSLTLPA